MPEHPCACHDSPHPPAPPGGSAPSSSGGCPSPKPPGALCWLGRCPVDLVPLLDGNSPGQGLCPGAALGIVGKGREGPCLLAPDARGPRGCGLALPPPLVGEPLPRVHGGWGGGARPAPPHPPARPARGKSPRQCHSDAPALLPPLITAPGRRLRLRGTGSEESAARQPLRLICSRVTGARGR